jgi:hypothetical protein
MKIIGKAKGGGFRYWEDGQWQTGFWDGNRTLVTIADDGFVTNIQRFASKEQMARYVKNLKNRAP